MAPASGLAPLLFADEELDGIATSAIRSPAEPSDSVRRKKTTHQTAAGLPVHSFRTLLAHLGTSQPEDVPSRVGPEWGDVHACDRA